MDKKYFTLFNKKEAVDCIGKQCMFSDSAKNLEARRGLIGTLIGIEEDSEYSFMAKNDRGEACFRFCSPVEKKLRPYQNFEEMVKDAMEHGLDDNNFKIRGKNVYMLRVALLPCGVVDYYFSAKEDEFISFLELAEKYTWADGTPCGVEEEI